MIRGLLIGALFAVFVIWLVEPLIKLERQRRSSRVRKPCTGDIFIQDHEPITVIATDDSGLTIRAADGQEWREDYGAWRERLRLRVVVYGGRREAISDELARW